MSESNLILEVRNISKSFHGLAGSKIIVLDGINLKIDFENNKGKINTIVSPPKSGKSTLLKIISAIEMPTAGDVILYGNKYSNPDGSIALIPEKASSFPWMNVKQNVEFGLNIKNYIPEILRKKREELISFVGLEGYEEHFPHEKDSGFRFRISLARALAVEPKIILLDNPFHNLGKETKTELYSLIEKVKYQYKMNFILATANVNESILLSDNIFLMKKNPSEIVREIHIDDQTKNNLDADKYNSLKSEIEKSFGKHEEFFNLS